MVDKKEIVKKIAENERKKKEILMRTFIAGSSNLDGLGAINNSTINGTDNTLVLDDSISIHGQGGVTRKINKLNPASDKSFYNE